MRTVRYLRFVVLATLLISSPAAAQTTTGVVVDQTDLPLPGVRIDLERGGQIVATVTTSAEGSFTLTGAHEGDIVVATLDGFETTRVPLAQAARLILPLAHTSEVTQVTASALTSSGAAMERLGSSMTAPLAQKLPVQRPRILQSLPLLPGVIRGPDGQLRIGGTRPHESALWIDGFDVTDPVTRTSAIDLPNEAVKGMAVLRDPIAATFNGVLGSLASIETLPGGDQFRAGVQGFIPRPRLSNYGLGKIEGFFPRAYAGGRLKGLHYFTSVEYNFERVPVPGVTSRSGHPDTGATGLTSFSRIDLGVGPTQHLTLEGLFAPGDTTFSGLSPLRGPEASPDVRTRDIFVGVVDHVVLGSSDLLTVRFGNLAHGTALSASGSGESLFRPSGWSQNWFAAVDHWGVQRSLTVTWDHAGVEARGAHTFSTIVSLRQRAMNAVINEQAINVLDDFDRPTRSVEFSPGVRLRSVDNFSGLGFRDLWDLTSRIQIDAGIRLDRGDDALVASPRAGIRIALDEQARTVFKGSVGRFVGYPPLATRGFNQFPRRVESTFDPATGENLRRISYMPVLGDLGLPRADGVAFDIEHRVTPRLEVQAGVRARDGSRLPTVMVPRDGGTLLLASSGASSYREFQVSLRQEWRPNAQAFLSYVWSSSRGDINDFGTLYTSLTTPLIQPGGAAPTPGDIPHRLRGWGTVELPRKIVVSPSIEWRTGFPYSVLDLARFYVGPPNGARFPQYFATDVTVFKTFGIIRRTADLGLQIFNLTGHFNPRDVIPVRGSAQFGDFSNSFGVTLGGYMQVRWQ